MLCSTLNICVCSMYTHSLIHSAPLCCVFTPCTVGGGWVIHVYPWVPWLWIAAQGHGFMPCNLTYNIWDAGTKLCLCMAGIVVFTFLCVVCGHTCTPPHQPPKPTSAKTWFVSPNKCKWGKSHVYSCIVILNPWGCYTYSHVKWWLTCPHNLLEKH